MIEHTKRMLPWTGDPPATWDDVTWPSWVPRELASSIEHFWATVFGRGPSAYAENALATYNRGPGLGERVVRRIGNEVVEGRWVFAWNNMGRIVTDDGRYRCASTNGYFSIDEVWDRSRSSGVAIVVGSRGGMFSEWEFAGGEPVDRLRFYNRMQAKENGRRDRATPAVCGMVAMAYVESREVFATRIAGVHLRNIPSWRPTYTELRNYLVGELDAAYVVACVVAFAVIERENRRYHWADGSGAFVSNYAEPGWL